MVVQFSHVGKRNFMSGDSNDFKLKNLFNNPDLEFTHKKSGDKVTITLKPKFEGNLFSTLQSNKPNPNGLNERYGWKNDWSPNGQILAVGSPFYELSTVNNIDAGRVYFYKFDELSKANPQPFNILERENEVGSFGSYLRFSKDGTKIAIGARTKDNKGAVYIYNVSDILNGANPNPLNKIQPNNLTAGAFFGVSLEWNYNDSQLAIGSAQNNSIGYVYIYNTDNFNVPVNILNPVDRIGLNFVNTYYGYKVSWDSNNKYLAVSAMWYDQILDNDIGAVYIYSVENLKFGINPNPNKILKPTNSQFANFGWEVKFSPNGKQLAIGSPGEFKVYIYDTNTILNDSQPVIISTPQKSFNCNFGISLDWNPSSTKLVIADALFESEIKSMGCVYLYDVTNIYTGMKPMQQIIMKGLINVNATDEGFGRGLRWHPSNRYLVANAWLNNKSGSLFVLH